MSRFKLKSRSKERGKPVSELTARELSKEKTRCKTWIESFPNTVAAKRLRKRLEQIEKRCE